MATNSEEPDLNQLLQEINSLKRHLRIVSHHKKTIALSIPGFKGDQSGLQLSESFYTQPCGHKICLGAELIKSKENPEAKSFVIHACLMKGEFDYELEWPIKAKVTIQIQNQSGDMDHIQRSKQIAWQYKSLGDPLPIPIMTDVDMGVLLGDVARYVVRDTLQLTVKYMALDK